MSEDRPWETGATPDDRWAGYFQPGYVREDLSTHVLRNKLDGIQTADELAYVEGPITTARAMILKETPIEPATYNLEHLRAIHRELFQDIYAWAGDVRTVRMSKGGAEFTPPEAIADTVNSVGRFLESNDYFRGGDRVDVVSALAVGYGIVNTAHPFREGNGRTQRILWDQFASESGHYIAWDHLQSRQNDIASQQARLGNEDALPKMFARIVHHEQDRARVNAARETRRATLQGLADRRPGQRAAGANSTLPYDPPSYRTGRGGMHR